MRRFTFSSRLPALDGIRGLAILMVFFFHYAGGHAVQSRLMKAALVPFHFGWAGVDLFFVLSGFLITGILYETRDSPHYYRTFYARRTLRIFPIYYLFCFVVFALTPVIHAHWQWQHLFYLVYLGNPAVIFWPSLVSFSTAIGVTHLWSLAVEEQFYVAWPFVVRTLGTAKRLLIACLLMIGIAATLRIYLIHFWPTSYASLTSVYYLVFCRMDALAIGASLAILIRSRLRESILRHSQKFFAILGAVVVSILMYNGNVGSGGIMGTIGYTLLALWFCTVVAMSLSHGVTERLFSTAWLRFFGRYSYGLYLYHYALQPALRYFQPTGTAMLGIWVLASLGICTGVAWLSFQFIEDPILRLKSRFQYRQDGAHGDSKGSCVDSFAPDTGVHAV